MSYYTKYRPQTIAELDLVLVRESLSQILSSGRFSHAYLFSGPKGTGKTSSARILAKVLNCDRNKDGNGKLKEPCNECNSCKRITSGMSMAVMEMDAASNRGIDDIRTLKERIGLTPVEGLYAVYIIDEVHMLTTEAFNALLKTLEEPPEHAIFILCTTDPQKIPDTVISRCTRVVFQKASSEEIVLSLAKAIKGEKLEIEAGVLEEISGKVDGSFRDGMKTLEQLAQQGKMITVSMVDEILGVGGDYDVKYLIDMLLQKDACGALKEVSDKQALGIDVGVYSRRLVESLREIMLKSVKNGDIDTSIQLANTFSLAAVAVKQAVLPWLPLEIAVAEWCLDTNKVGGNDKSQIPNVKQITNIKEQIFKPEVTEVKKTEPKIEVREPVRIGSYVGSLDDVKGKWHEVLAVIRATNYSMEALLKSARLAEYEDGWLTIEAFYKFHKEQLEQDRYRKKLEEAVSTVLGGSVYLKFRLGEQIKISRDKRVDNVSGSVEDEALVKAAEEIFG
jgi:DNA polymerase-3 subunit gamma/tau